MALHSQVDKDGRSMLMLSQSHQTAAFCAVHVNTQQVCHNHQLCRKAQPCQMVRAVDLPLIGCRYGRTAASTTQKAVTSGKSARMQKVPLMLTGPQQGYPCHPRRPCPLPCCPRSSPELERNASVTLLVTTLLSCCFAQTDCPQPHPPTSTFPVKAPRPHFCHLD